MRKTLLIGLLLSNFFSILPALPAWAGQWSPEGPTWKYIKDDGNIATSEWIADGGQWYHFDNLGIMETGWIKDNDKFYFLGGDGVMYVNRLTPTGYYLGADGTWDPDYVASTSDESSNASPNHSTSSGSSDEGSSSSGGIGQLEPGFSDGPKQ